MPYVGLRQFIVLLVPYAALQGGGASGTDGLGIGKCQQLCIDKSIHIFHYLNKPHFFGGLF